MAKDDKKICCKIVENLLKYLKMAEHLLKCLKMAETLSEMVEKG
jgi:hypothetical protein